MKSKVFNISAFLFIAFIIAGYIYNDIIFDHILYKTKVNNEIIGKRDKYHQFYNDKIREIYLISDQSLDLSIALVDSIQKLYPEKTNDLDYVSARIYLQHGSLDIAKSKIDKLINLEWPIGAKSLELLAYIQLYNNNFQKAEETLMKLNAISTKYRFQLGNYYEIQQNDSLAMETYNQIISERYFQVQQASKRRESILAGKQDKLKNIKLSNDSERVYFSLGKLKLY